MLNTIKRPALRTSAFEGKSLIRQQLLSAKRSVRLVAIVAGAVAALQMAPITALGGQARTAVDAIPTDVDISGPFLQKPGKDPHDPAAVDRCGEPEITLDVMDPNILVVSCMSTAGLSYQDPRPRKNYSAVDITKSGDWYEPCYTFISHDGGKSWARVQPDPTLSSPLIIECSDPLAQWGPHGELYLGGDAFHFPVQGKFAPVLALPGGSFPLEGLGISFSRSLDGGKTWSKPVLIPTAIDRPFWTVDQSTGVIYSISGCADVTTIGAYGCTPSSRNLAVSTDQGQTWTPTIDVWNKEPPTQTLTPGHLHNISPGSNVAAANGVFASAGANRENHAVVFEYSTDQGVTFTQRPIPLGDATPCASPSAAGIAANPTHRGSFAVIVLCPPNPKAVRVFLTRDLGETWMETASLVVPPPPGYASDPSVHDPSPYSQGIDTSTVVSKVPNNNFEIDRPWVAYGPTGALGVLWRQDYYVPAMPPAAAGAQGAPQERGSGIRPGPQDVFVAISADGGAKFAEPFRVNTAASPAPDPRQLGNDDTSQIILDKHYAYAVWGDWRSGELQSWFRKVPIPAR
jgi:hypothetical protein